MGGYCCSQREKQFKPEEHRRIQNIFGRLQNEGTRPSDDSIEYSSLDLLFKELRHFSVQVKEYMRNKRLTLIEFMGLAEMICLNPQQQTLMETRDVLIEIYFSGKKLNESQKSQQFLEDLYSIPISSQLQSHEILDKTLQYKLFDKQSLVKYIRANLRCYDEILKHYFTQKFQGLESKFRLRKSLLSSIRQWSISSDLLSYLFYNFIEVQQAKSIEQLYQFRNQSTDQGTLFESLEKILSINEALIRIQFYDQNLNENHEICLLLNKVNGQQIIQIARVRPILELLKSEQYKLVIDSSLKIVERINTANNNNSVATEYVRLEISSDLEVVISDFLDFKKIRCRFEGLQTYQLKMFKIASLSPESIESVKGQQEESDSNQPNKDLQKTELRQENDEEYQKIQSENELDNSLSSFQKQSLTDGEDKIKQQSQLEIYAHQLSNLREMNTSNELNSQAQEPLNQN